MYQSVSVPVALRTVVALTLVLPVVVTACPRSCNCYQASEVHCTFRSLLAIPPGLPAHTRRANLGFNSISRINDRSLMGLKRLELLMLHSNDLHHIPDAVFGDLKSLQILKLSYNKLREIPSSMTFSGLTSLLRLYLDHNLLEHIHPRALLQLPSLRLLRLQGNRLHQLHPHTLCTLSLLNTYYFSTLRHLDLSNNTLTTLAKATLATAPLLETLVVQDNPWSCDCRMNWFLAWILDHPGLMKCPGGPQCPICASPNSLQGHALLEQSDLSCTSPVIPSVGREGPLEADISEILSSESFREPLGSASLDLSDQQGNNVNLSCNITRSSDSQDSTPFPDLSLSSSSPLHLALSLSLDCPVERQSYEKLWRILAYYSETAVRLEREIMLSKAPTLAYRYKQTAETVGYYHSGVKASVKTRPHWLLQPAISIQLNRAQSNGHKVQLIYSTRVSAHSDSTTHPLTSSTISHPWVLFSNNQTATALAAAAGSKVELPCPVLSSGNPKVQWILPDGSKHVSPYNSLDSRMWASATGLVLQKVLLSDAGIYYCVAQAGRDVDVLPLRLAVAESSIPPSGEPVGPSVASGVGQPVILSCNASGSPEPQISWLLPDGNIIRWGLAISGGLTVQRNGSLSLANLSQRDAGYYRCVAVNQYGSDSLSMQLELHPQHPPQLKTYFPRGPQSAAGRSTKIRAPLLFQVGEGSGDEEEKEDRTLFGNKRRPRPFQPSTNRRYPAGNPRRRGPMRGPPRRGPLSSTDQRRNHLQNRYRVTSNKQRIDPQKWADLLAKIRQKTTHTNNNEPNRTGKPKAEVGTGKSEDGDDDLESDRIEGTLLELETEGSSADIPNLEEEGLRPIQPILIVTDTEADTEIKHGVVRSTVKPTDIENERETHVPREKAGLQTEIVRNPDSLKELFTSKPILVTNKIIQEPGEADEREADPSPSRIHPEKHQQGVLPNLIPNFRPQRPWPSRRRIGQRRRIINRPGLRPLMPPQLLPDPSNPKSQNETSKTITDQTSLLLLTSTTSSPANLFLQNVALNYLPTSLSHTSGTTTSAFDSPSVTSFPSSLTSVSPTSTDMMTRSANIPDPADFTPTPTPLDNTTTAKHISDTYSTQTETKTHSAVGKPVDRPSDTHREELGRMNTPYMSHSHSSILPPLSSIIPSTLPITSTFTSATEKTPSAAPESTPLSSTSTSTTDTLCTTTVDPVTTTTAIIPLPSSTRSTKTMFTTVTSTTPRSTSTTTTTTTAITSTIPATTTTSATTTIPVAISPYPSHIATRTATKTAAPATSRITISAKTSITTTKATTSSAASTTIMAMIPITASSKEGINVDQVDQKGRPVSAVPNHRRFPTDWNNPGANSIPDSHSSRRRQPSSPPLPAAPGAPVLRFRPRIADPRIRTVSFPAESTARLPCEAQGVPKPSITWTKIPTGAVMSIRSRAQRFEVLPNGTLVIQNVQLQDRGTYICSAHSFLGRDRLLTTLEVWTRPPRMGVPTYRETTIHQGGELHLECQAEGVPTPLLSWVLPDRSVLTSNASSSSRITMDTNATLHISVILKSDRGMYRCVASNPAGAASASVNIHVSSLPPVIQLPRKEHLLLSPGMPVYAHCTAHGAPPPTVRWRIPDGTLVRPSQFLHNIFVLPNGTLHIQKVGPKDAGNYECTASNAVGSDKRIVRVEIEGLAKGEKRQEGATNESAKVVISDKTSSSSLLLNDRTMSTPIHPSHPYSSNRFSPSLPFKGTLSSSLLSSYPHQHNSTNTPAEISKSVTVSPIHVTNTNKSRPSSFSPQSIRPTENSNVSSGFGSNTSYFPADKSRALAVLHPLPVSPFSKAHIVSTSPSISTVHHGGDLQLHCSVTGNPPPIIIWRTPSKKLVDRNFSFDRRLKVHPNGTLSVRAVTEKDNGDYLCITRNKVADDYRLLRVSVSTKPAKIEPKQPLNQMVLFGKPLKVDCQASGLPDPAVRWKLPDGTMVNSVLQSEHGGRARRLIVFDNGTLVVPAVGMGEDGEYTCYAENQGGQDTMKVKVKVMMAYSPTFINDKRYYSVKVQQGATATLRCQATGNPLPTITWFSPRQRAIPQSLGSRRYFERVAVVSDGTLEVRQAQKLDTGNYTCRASNSAGERSMVVGLEVEASNYGLGDQVGGRGWSPNKGPGSTYSSGSRGSINNAGISQDGFTNGAGGKLDNSYSNNDNSDNNDEKMNSVPRTSAQTGNSGLNPTFNTNAQNKFDQPVHTITTQLGVGLGKNTDIKANQIGPNPNGPSIESGRYNMGSNHTTVRESTERNSVFNNNDVNERKASNANTKEDTGRISGTSHNVGVFRSSVSNIGAATSAGAGVINENSRGRSSSNTGTNPSKTHSTNTNNTIVGVATVKQKALKGQTILLPCPSQGSPPPRLAWHLPGNGVLPAPYYGSRFTVYRNGSLELRGVWVSDGGTFVCVVRGERQEVRIQVELEVSEPLEEARASHRGSGGERFVPESTRSHSRASVDIPQSVNSRSMLPERLRSRNPVTQKPLQKGLSFPSAPLPIVPPPRSTTPVSEPVVRTRTDPLVTIINGETLHLPCPASQTPGHTRGSLSWTLPSGKVLSFSEGGDSGRHWIQEDGTLTVQQTSVFDRGTYTCRSTSYDSTSVSAVTIPVIIIAYPPRITMGPSPLTYTRPGVAVELPCLTIATPRATVTWETPDLTRLKVMGQARIYGNRYLSSQGSLVIQNPTDRDTGFYKCTANNEIGVDTKVTYLRVI